MTRKKPNARHVELLRALNRDPALPAVAHAILEHPLEILPQAQSGSFLALNDEEGVVEYQAAVGWDLGASGAERCARPHRAGSAR